MKTAVLAAALLSAGAAGAAVKTLALPPLALPSAPTVRLEACKWGTGAKTLTVTRKVGQSLNVVNLDTVPHLLKQAGGTRTAMPWWPLAHNESVGFTWHGPAKLVIATCSGTVKLTVTVTN